MLSYLAPRNLEADRLDALHGSGLLDTGVEESFDRLVRLAARLLDAPMALVTLVGEDRQFFKSCTGIPEPWATERQTPLSHSFCRYPVETHEPLVVENTREDPRVRDNPAIEALDIGAYAGIPLITSDGHALGALCAMDHRPRAWREDEIAILRDLARSVETEIELRRALRERERAGEERFRATFEQAAVGLAHVAPDGKWLRVNRRFCEIVGYPREELLDLTFQDITHPDDLDADLAQVQRLLHGESSSYQREKRYLRKDGQLVWVLLTVSLVRGTGGEPEYLISVVEDISAHREAQSALRRSEEHFRALIENASDIITILDERGIVRYGSPATGRELGWRREELVGRHVLKLVHPGDRPRVRRALVAVMQVPGAITSVEFRFRHSDGSWRTLEALGTNLLRDEAVGGVVVNSRDITDRRTVEEALTESRQQLLQAQKMEAVGRLAGGVAHDFNNVLTIIKSVTQMLLMDAGEESPIGDDLREIEAAANRGASLTRQLLAFSRKQVLQPIVLDLNGVVREMDRMLRRLIGEDVDLSTHLDTSLRPTRADPGQMEQILVNLVVNARDAMPEGGEIRIETRNLRAPAPGHSLPGFVRRGEYVLLTVRDTGTGMDEETRERIWEPFFTTKEQGKGTGIGLSTVYGIIEQTGGHIWVESEPGRGSAFHVLLPSAEAEGEEAPSRAVRGTLGGSETLLLVEDEDPVRSTLKRLLVRGGYTVLEAASGPEALHLAGHHSGPIHLLITDVVMPGMNGAELAEEMARLRPDTPVLFMSGYTSDAPVLRRLSESGAALIEKPFPLEAFVRRVRELVDVGLTLR